ncbi:hypothetical protein V565_315060 [Rhizoctonia solani 123E]|uniref:Uncharacterized protein n=1 Tax=Rhizoctonia solani 123E TaxID=1423351 RepID=A0A074RI96_9AGAM|nr:hypothetical protein V565_315060 [Rhizoctonia solani 123E]
MNPNLLSHNGTNGGDCIRAAVACNPTSVYGKRDASFIRYSYRKDKNEDDPHARIKMVSATGYGRLDFIVVVPLPHKTPPRKESDDSDTETNEEEEELEPVTHVLAQITEAKGVEGDATTKLHTYRELGRTFILDVKNVEHVVARVFTRAVRPNASARCTKLWKASRVSCISQMWRVGNN